MLFFNINYYLCKQYPAFTPFMVDDAPAEDVFTLYIDTKKVYDEMNEYEEEPEKVKRVYASDNEGWW